MAAAITREGIDMAPQALAQIGAMTAGGAVTRGLWMAMGAAGRRMASAYGRYVRIANTANTARMYAQRAQRARKVLKEYRHPFAPKVKMGHVYLGTRLLRWGAQGAGAMVAADQASRALSYEQPNYQPLEYPELDYSVLNDPSYTWEQDAELHAPDLSHEEFDRQPKP